MTKTFSRMQILLEPEQQKALAALAERQERSISDLLREIVQAYLDIQSEEAQMQAERAALKQLKAIREQSRQSYGVFPGNLVDDIRRERDEDFDLGQQENP